jgi:hypothetical protein
MSGCLKFGMAGRFCLLACALAISAIAPAMAAGPQGEIIASYFDCWKPEAVAPVAREPFLFQSNLGPVKTF